MPAKLTHLDLEISLKSKSKCIQAFCVAPESVKKHRQRKEEASEGGNLAVVQGSAEHYLSPKFTYGAAFHKVCI